MFYGALSERIAVAECRPSVGALVVVGRFAVAHEIVVLDLPGIGSELARADVFSSDFAETSRRLTALRYLEHDVSYPVQAHEQEREYAPTQVFANFIQQELGLDGIAYRSAAAGVAPSVRGFMGPLISQDERSLALFGEAGTVAGDHALEGSRLRFIAGSAEVRHIRRIELSYDSEWWLQNQEIVL